MTTTRIALGRVPITRSTARTRRTAGGPGVPSPLPAWPLLALMYGFPIFWATGTSLFAPVALGAVMGTFLLLRGRVRTSPGVLCWFAFLAWVAVCAASVTGVMQLIGFGQRAADLLAVGIAFVYFVNARASISLTQVLRGFTVIWATVVVLGILATQFPDFRLTTPLSRIIPGSLLGNELVRELVLPRLAEVQEPWGAEEPFVRPAAPFPYTNSWGMAYALLTPVMVFVWTRLSSWAGRILLAIALVASLYPAAQTSNRGMLLALAMFALLIAGRFVLAGSLRTGITVIGLLGLATLGAAAGGVFSAIAERQEVSHTTSGRGAIYEATFEKVLQSPIVGWATPGMDPTIGIALGTQGYAWTLLYSYGFIGILLFYVFLARVITASWHLRDPASHVFLSLVITVALTIWFYGLGVTQCLILLMAAAVLSRSVMDEEAADG